MVPIIFVHGFNHDPRAPGPDHPEDHLFPLWRRMLGREYSDEPFGKAVGFEWFSKPHVLDAWKHGRWNRYRYAWDLATDAADRLRMILNQGSEPSDIVCHSLGSRVTLLALRSARPGVANRVLILNGAEYGSAGAATARACQETKFYNVVVPADDVISKLARFAPGFGNDFLGSHGAPESANWTNLRFKSGRAAAYARFHNLAAFNGDNPDDMGDHAYSYENAANWPLYRAIFNGEWDAWANR